MRHRPDGTYKWIGHYMDHWSKFHVLFALQENQQLKYVLVYKIKCFAFWERLEFYTVESLLMKLCTI